MMGNHKTKRLRALEHNRAYAIKRGETAATNQPKQAVNIGTVGLVHDGKSFVTKTESKPKQFKDTLSAIFCLYLIFFAFFEGATWLIQF